MNKKFCWRFAIQVPNIHAKWYSHIPSVKVPIAQRYEGKKNECRNEAGAYTILTFYTPNRILLCMHVDEKEYKIFDIRLGFFCDYFIFLLYNTIESLKNVSNIHMILHWNTPKMYTLSYYKCKRIECSYIYAIPYVRTVHTYMMQVCDILFSP